MAKATSISSPAKTFDSLVTNYFFRQRLEQCARQPLAARLGVSENVVRAYEVLGQPLDVGEFLSIAAALGVDPVMVFERLLSGHGVDTVLQLGLTAASPCLVSTTKLTSPIVAALFIELRHDANLTIQQAAMALDVTGDYISNIECLNANVNLEEFVLLCLAYFSSPVTALQTVIDRCNEQKMAITGGSLPAGTLLV